jgi:MinD-like ATPase involved in chromosome partitioning or flagellar assembly
VSLPRARRREAPARAEPQTLGLRFDRRGGPLVAVCGVVGGAGASSIACLLATAAARESTTPVLVCDTGGPQAGVALYTNADSRHTLAELAESLLPETGGRAAPRGRTPFAERDDGLRVLASGPRFRLNHDPAGVADLLAQAQSAHGLTVVDCGTLQREADQLALQIATHAVWVLPATPTGLMRAWRTLALVRPVGGREILVARHVPQGRRAAARALDKLAADRDAPLVRVPALPDLAEVDASAAIDVAQVTLAAFGRLLRR